MPGLDPPGHDGARVSSASDRALAVRTRDGLRSPVVPAAALLVSLTAPGQTAVISVFVQPISDDLGIPVLGVSAGYLVATLLGALLLPFAGRLTDRHGTSRVTTVVALGFGIVLLLAATVRDVWGLTAAFTGMRGLGQGALGLLATTAVALAVRHRRGTALGVVQAIGSASIALAPLLVAVGVLELGWRATMAWCGVAVLVLGPVTAATLLPRRPPSDPSSDLRPSQDLQPSQDPSPRTADATLREAMRTGAFWLVTGLVASTGLLGTAVTFHQFALLGETGLSTLQVAATAVPLTAASLLAAVLAGMAADRLPVPVLLSLVALALTAALLTAPFATPGLAVVSYSVLLGASMGATRVVEAATLPRLFGVIHLGSMRGFIAAVGVGSTAFGPLALSGGHALLGSYGATAAVLAVLPGMLVVLAFVVPSARGR